MHMWEDKLITKHLPLDPHMSGNMFTWYLKERLLRVSETFAHVDDSIKKLKIRDKTKPLSSQKVGPKNRQPGVTRFKYFIMSFRKCTWPCAMCPHTSK